MVFPIRFRYIITIKVIVLNKLDNILLKALVIILVRALTITLLIAATTLGTSGDTSIANTDL